MTALWLGCCSCLKRKQEKKARRKERKEKKKNNNNSNNLLPNNPNIRTMTQKEAAIHILRQLLERVLDKLDQLVNIGPLGRLDTETAPHDLTHWF